MMKRKRKPVIKENLINKLGYKVEIVNRSIAESYNIPDNVDEFSNEKVNDLLLLRLSEKEQNKPLSCGLLGGYRDYDCGYKTSIDEDSKVIKVEWVNFYHNK